MLAFISNIMAPCVPFLKEQAAGRRALNLSARPNRNRLECKQVMAEHVLSPTPKIRSTRRAALGSGLVAFAAAASAIGITAGAAASVADLVPPNLDADLIALCEQFNAIETRCRTTVNAATTGEEEEHANLLADQLYGGQHHSDWPVLNRICATPGSTHAAAVALASTLATWNTGKVAFLEDDPDAYVADRLTAALMRCLLGSASA